MRIEKQGEPIRTLDDWFRLAPPKGREAQWVDGRSAKELARAWLEAPSELPLELMALLESCPDIDGLEIEKAQPETLLAFDRHAGPRNADVAVWARDRLGPLAITVEGKADEPFDAPISDVFSRALERLMTTPESGGIARIAQLAQSLFTSTTGYPIATLRYQLLTATAGTLAHAAALAARRAVLLIHEFTTPATSRRLLAENAEDFRRFLSRLSNNSLAAAREGVLYGPFQVHGKPLFPRPAALYIGKATRQIGEPND